jgi:hypothetical protein
MQTQMMMRKAPMKMKAATLTKMETTEKTRKKAGSKKVCLSFSNSSLTSISSPYLFEMDDNALAGLNIQGAQAATRALERAIRGPIPQVRTAQNREAIIRGVVQIANGLFRRRAVPMDIDTPFDPSALGLKEIGNLASWTVSSCKPGCGVEALRDDDTGLFWQ